MISVFRYSLHDAVVINYIRHCMDIILDSMILMAHSFQLRLETQRYWVRIPTGSNVCHRGCACTVFQTAQWHGSISPSNEFTLTDLNNSLHNNLFYVL